jgi:predicted nucleic acid-binding protein
MKDGGAFVEDLALVAVVIELRGNVRACRDPDDDKLLEIAARGGADCIVTGDQGLLILNPFHGIAILTPADFMQAVAAQTT